MAMTNNDGLHEAIGALERAGFSGIRTITWDRQYPGLGAGLRHQTEFVLVGPPAWLADPVWRRSRIGGRGRAWHGRIGIRR